MDSVVKSKKTEACIHNTGSDMPSRELPSPGRIFVYISGRYCFLYMSRFLLSRKFDVMNLRNYRSCTYMYLDLYQDIQNKEKFCARSLTRTNPSKTHPGARHSGFKTCEMGRARLRNRRYSDPHVYGRTYERK